MARARMPQRRQPNTRHETLHSTDGGGRGGLFLRSDEENPMSSNEASAASDGGPDKTIYNEEEMRRAISRIAHEIVERNAGAGDLVLIGLQTRGLPLAERLAAKIADLEGVTVPVAALDTRDYRDDRPERSERLSRFGVWPPRRRISPRCGQWPTDGRRPNRRAVSPASKVPRSPQRAAVRPGASARERARPCCPWH